MRSAWGRSFFIFFFLLFSFSSFPRILTIWSDDEEDLGKTMSSAAAMQDRESGAGGGADEGGVLGRSRAITHDRSRNLGTLRATDSPRSGVGSGSEGGVGSGGSANGMHSSWKKKGASGNGTPSGGVPSGLPFFFDLSVVYMQ